MNILMINGTMRHSSSYRIGKMLVERISLPGDSIKKIFLPKDLPEFCRGCGNCLLYGEKYCPDYVIYTRKIEKYLDEADVLVFTTPTYAYHTSGQMKAFLDHFSYQWMIHRPKESMFHKQAFCISTGAGAGMKKAAEDIMISLKFWGVAKIYSFSVAVEAMDWDNVSKEKKDYIDQQLYRLMWKQKKNRKKGKPTRSCKWRFYLMRSLQKKHKSLDLDYEYWLNKGWLGNKRPWKAD